MVRMELSQVIINEASEAQIIVLKEQDGPRSFPILIGTIEAAAIDRGVHERRTPRPMTHDLLNNLINDLDVHLERVVINDLRQKTFYARLVILRDGERIEVDSRPSDAIALAVRVGAPIFVEEEVFDMVGKPESKPEE